MRKTKVQAHKINRRNFLAAGLAAGGILLETLGYNPKSEAVPVSTTNSIPKKNLGLESVISAETMQARQQRLNELVQEYDGFKTVESIIYDHDGSSIRKVPAEYAREILSDEMVNNVKSAISSMQGMSKEQKDNYISLLSSQEGKAEIEQRIKIQTESLVESYIKNAQGITPFNTRDFGLQRKSKIYMPITAFDGRVVEMGDGTKVDYSAEVALKVRVRHEIFHAEGVYGGIDFEEGLILDNASFKSLRREVKDFANEFYAHFNTYQFFKKHGLKDETVVAVDYFKNNIGSMFKTVVPLASSGVLSNFEHRLVYFLSEKWNNLLPELAPIVKEPIPK